MAIFELSNAAGVGFDMSTTGNNGFAFVQTKNYITNQIVYEQNGTTIWHVYGSDVIDAYEINYSRDGYNIIITFTMYFTNEQPILTINDVNLKTTFADLYSASVFVRLNAQSDIFYGNDYNDVIHGGSGDDNVIGYLGDDTLFGDEGDDILSGGGGNDMLVGGDGYDTAGYRGSSTDYIFSQRPDGWVVVADTKIDGWGSDLVSGIEQFNFSNGSFSPYNLLPRLRPYAQTSTSSSVGHKTVYGSDRAETLRGNAGDELLYGYGGNDRLFGGQGSDKLFGGVGKDYLSGGSGSDYFIFNSKPSKSNVDKVADFRVRDDTVQLDNAFMKKVGKHGTLKKDAFWVGTKAHDASDRIIYDKKKGVLYYDDDGSGAHIAVQLAIISKNLKMTYKDFVII